jgi:hypothetical protein
VNPRPRRVGANGVGAERTEIRDDHFDGVLMVIHDEDVEAVQTARRQGAHVGGAKSNAPNATLGSPTYGVDRYQDASPRGATEATSRRRTLR